MADIDIMGNVHVGGGNMFEFETQGKRPTVDARFNSKSGQDGTFFKLKHTETLEGILEELEWPLDIPRDKLVEAIDLFLKSVGESEEEKEKILTGTRLAQWLQTTANIGNIGIAFKALADSGAIVHLRRLLGL